MSTIKFNKSEDMSGGDELLKKALDVSEDDSDGDTGPPMDGMAYLKQVIKERRRIADTVTAEIDPGKLKQPNINDIYGVGGKRSKPSVPAEFTPSTRWQNQQIAEFSDTRLKLSRHLSLVRSSGELRKPLKIPDKENEMLWCLFCYGRDTWREISNRRKEVEEEEEKEEKEKEDKEEKEEGNEAEKEKSPDVSGGMLETVLKECAEGTQPSLRVILSTPIHVIERVLEYQVSWLELTGWRPEYGVWLYALLSRIEKPLHPDLGSVLRDLVLFCSQERARLVEKCLSAKSSQNPAKTDGNGAKMTGDVDNGSAMDGELPHDKDIAAFNLFICLVAKYFDQADLVDADL